MGRESDALTLAARLAEAPYRFDFYQALRRLECAYEMPRWGAAERPAEEPVRLGQVADLGFAPATLAAFEHGAPGERPRLLVRHFGLLGPNGPLPLHLTEYVRDRLRHAADPTLARFLDLLHHRFLAMFYRAWAQAQPHVNRDRPREDRFATYVGAFVGMAPESLRHRDSIPDEAKLFHAGTLARGVRTAEGLRAILQDFFAVPVRIEQFVGWWMAIAADQRSSLGTPGCALGRGAVAGDRVWDRQYKIRVHLGPLTLEQFREFLPGGRLLRPLVDWVRFYTRRELAWDVRLHLSGAAVPAARLGAGSRLGWTTWVGRRAAARHADDLCLDAEAFMTGAGATRV